MHQYHVENSFEIVSSAERWRKKRTNPKNLRSHVAFVIFICLFFDRRWTINREKIKSLCSMVERERSLVAHLHILFILFFFYAVQPTQIFTTHIFFPTCNSTRFFFSSACFFPIHSFPISNFTRSLFFNVCLICIIESIFYEGNIFYFQIWMHRVSERTGKKTCTLLVRFNLKIED